MSMMRTLLPETGIKSSEKRTDSVNAEKDEISDEELLAGFGKGDEAAADRLIRRYRDRAYAVAWSMCDRDAEEAKEAVQDAFVKTLKNISKFRGQSSFYTWFYRILVNTCLDRRRKQRLRRKFFIFRSPEKREEGEENIVEEQADISPASNPLAVLSGNEFGKEVHRALESLSEKQRTVFQLKVFHGMSIAEIAEVLHTAQGTVKSHLFRATQYLRESLKEWQDMKI
jgi:RNA polymerase sigma-70 factor (ECF subfamily)